MYTEFNREKIIDWYKESVPDYKVTGRLVNIVVDNTIETQWLLLFRKGDRVLNLDEAILELNLQAPDEIIGLL